MSTFSLLPSLPVGPVLKLYFYLQRQQQQVLYFNTDSVCRKVHGFTLNVRGQQQLNYNIVRQNLLDELMDPLDESRNINVVNPNFFTRHSATKQLKVGPRTKRYGLVWSIRTPSSPILMDTRQMCSMIWTWKMLKPCWNCK